MKKLYLIRHAKASWDELNLTDSERPLNETGINDAHAIASQLKAQKVKPHLMITSPAKRALATAEIFAEELKFPLKDLLQNNEIYTGSVEELIATIASFDNKINNAMIFGHNPNLTWLVHYLCDDAKMNIPTCGVAVLQFTTNKWSEITEVDTRLIDFIHPHHELQIQ